MLIRPLRRADRDQVVRMRMALWPDSTPEEVDALLELPPTEYAVLVAERSDGRLAAFAEVGTRAYAEGCATSPVAYLEGIWVDADARRTGVGVGLLRQAEAWARARGLSELASDADIANQPSLDFHRAAGFQEVERIVCFRRDLRSGPSSGKR
ncbi:MAG: hypothetical protein AMXMBFR53_00090 [Gemmatimonadota bacterium]